MESLLPYAIVSTASFLASVMLLFLYLRRRVGDWLALAGVLPLLFMGTASEVLLWPFEMSFTASMATGIGALLALERGDGRRDALGLRPARRLAGLLRRPLVRSGRGRVDDPRPPPPLAHVRDPGNAGTVLRTADAAGAAGVIFTDASVDPYNGKCVRASAGSLFHLPVVAGARLASAVRELGEAGLRILAADSRGGRSLDEVIAAGTLRTPTAWLFGNEAWGLPDELLELADESVAVPIYGRAESLNLATAAAICLYASACALHG